MAGHTTTIPRGSAATLFRMAIDWAREPSLPEGYADRPASSEDLDAVFELVRGADIADWGEEDYSREELRHHWRLPELDLPADARLVAAPDGSLAGYGWVLDREEHRRLSGWAVVHPEHRGVGLGTFLIRWREHRAGEIAALLGAGQSTTLQSFLISVDVPSHDLMERNGYEAVRHFWRMDTSLGPEQPAPTWPHGVEVRSLRRGKDERRVHQVIEESFVGHWGWVARSFEDFAATRIEIDGFDPELWFVVTDGDRTVAALLGSIDDRVGWVETLGVLSGWRGRGIGEALLRHAFTEFVRRGIPVARLQVDSANASGATRLYERVGMHVARQYDVYERQIAASGG
jgi:mycothiol synthase